MYGVGFGYASIGSTTKRSGGGAAYSYILDTYSGAVVAYSLRKLSSTYTGNCIRVRRSSDNTEQNIGFVSNILDTASLLIFCGSGDGFVTTWYDQSGNANNATQTNATYQPNIVTSGSVNLLNSKPTINSSTVRYLTQNSSVTINSSFYVANYTSLNTVNYINQSVFLGGSAVNGIGMYDGVTAITSTIENISTHLISSLQLTIGNTSRLFVDNSQIGTSTAWIPVNTQTILGNINNLGALSNIGNVSEIIYYNSNQYTNFTGINTQINTFYGIY